MGEGAAIGLPPLRLRRPPVALVERGDDDGDEPLPLRRERGPRLSAYAALGAGGLVLALATARVEVVVLTAPFLLLAVVALAVSREPAVRLAVVAMSPRLVEGDRLDLEIELVADRPLTVEAVVRLRGPVRADEVAVVHRLGPEPLRWVVAPETGHWGLVRVDAVELRVHGPGGLVRWTGGVALHRVARVLPSASRADRLLPASQPRATAGAHLTRRRGDGTDPAEVRPHQPGDPLRWVSWKATAHRGELMVTARHPERSADVVLVVDTSDDGSGYPPVGLLQAVRVAWVLADRHLARQDRVGIVLFGRGLRWVLPRGGRRGREQLFDGLLAVTVAPRHPSRIDLLPHRAIPAGATVVALTTLHGEAFADALGTLRRHGHDVAVVVIDPTEQLGDELAGVPPEAVRMWRLGIEQRRRRLAAHGVRTAVIPAGAPPDLAVAGLAGPTGLPGLPGLAGLARTRGRRR